MFQSIEIYSIFTTKLLQQKLLKLQTFINLNVDSIFCKLNKIRNRTFQLLAFESRKKNNEKKFEFILEKHIVHFARIFNLENYTRLRYFLTKLIKNFIIVTYINTLIKFDKNREKINQFVYRNTINIYIRQNFTRSFFVIDYNIKRYYRLTQ